MMKSVRLGTVMRLTVIGGAVALGGCVNLSGLDGKSEFTCSAPNGVSCMSVSGVSANVDRGNLPSSVKTREQEELTRDLDESDKGKDKASIKTESTSDGKASQMAYGAAPIVSPALMPTPGSGTPIRVPPKELRIWLAPTEDSDGDLHDQRYIYVVVNDGRWMLDATRLNTRDKYTRFQPLGGFGANAETPESGKQRPPTPVAGQRAIQPAQPQVQAAP